MHVREWGSPDGRPLVFWHALGSGTSGAYLTEVAPPLTAAGLWLLAPDAPGFGESPALPPERYKTGSVVGMVRDLLDERERKILHLRFFEGLTQSQIAQQVGISQMHVSRLIRRSLEKIRAEIAADEEEARAAQG